jgi:hypothetical protein
VFRKKWRQTRLRCISKQGGAAGSSICRRLSRDRRCRRLRGLWWRKALDRVVRGWLCTNRAEGWCCQLADLNGKVGVTAVESKFFSSSLMFGKAGRKWTLTGNTSVSFGERCDSMGVVSVRPCQSPGGWNVYARITINAETFRLSSFLLSALVNPKRPGNVISSVPETSKRLDAPSSHRGPFKSCPNSLWTESKPSSAFCSCASACCRTAVRSCPMVLKEASACFERSISASILFLSASS